MDVRSLLRLVGHVRLVNISDPGGERTSEDNPWRYGALPKGDAILASVKHMVRYLAPKGVARFVPANGSKRFSQSGEGDIRTSLIEADMVNCMRVLPGQLFYPTQISRLPVDASGVERSRSLTRGISAGWCTERAAN